MKTFYENFLLTIAFEHKLYNHRKAKKKKSKNETIMDLNWDPKS